MLPNMAYPSLYTENKFKSKSRWKSESTLKKKDDSVQHEISVEEFVPKLLAAKTKEEAQLIIIIPQKLKKAILLEIASVLSVHVQKNDTKEKISYKIIESVVGAKLRSKAIKETELRKKHMDFWWRVAWILAIVGFKPSAHIVGFFFMS